MAYKKAFLFPAFITDYTQRELETISANGFDFKEYINKVSDRLGIVIPEFTYTAEEYKNDELLAQLIAFLFSCVYTDLLQKKNIKPDFVAGYSMGLYANLYSTGSITLKDGVMIIYKAFNLVNELACSGSYGMGGIIGLKEIEINEIIARLNSESEIINSNSEFSHVIAGEKPDVQMVLSLAKEEGALNATEFNVKTPYHSKYLKKFAERFKNYITDIEIKNPQFSIISTCDQRIISSTEEIRKELVYNLTSKINWYKTMNVLIDNEVKEFYECGAGKDLSKIARFIDGDFHFNPIHKL